jgi:hypothetical protein
MTCSKNITTFKKREGEDGVKRGKEGERKERKKDTRKG